MSLDDQRFAQLLRESTPQPPFDISPDAVVRQRERRRTAARTTIAAAAVTTLLAALVGVPSLFQRGTLIRVADATEDLSVDYHGVTFSAPDGWRLDEAPLCGRPADQSVVLGVQSPLPQTACPVPEPEQAPTWVGFGQIAPVDMWGPETKYDGKPDAQKIDLDGQPAYLQQETQGDRGYTLTVPWLGVRVVIKSPSDSTARDLVSRISAAASEDDLAVPSDADTVVLNWFGPERRGAATVTPPVTVTGGEAAAILEELRGLEIRQKSDPKCGPAPDNQRVQLTAYGPSREYRTYTIRSGDCAETYGNTGVAGATTRTLRSLVDQQLK